MTETPREKVVLREERHGADYRYLEAYVDEAGNVHIDGQDLGPGTAIVTDDGEYEWFTTIAVQDVPALIDLLGGGDDEHILTVLRRYTGTQSYELERRLRESDIHVERHVWY